MSAHERPTTRVSIQGKGASPGQVVLSLNGEEISTCTRAVLSLDADSVPTLKLSLIVLTDIKTDVPAYVLLDKPTRRALQAMGWTPPDEEES